MLVTWAGSGCMVVNQRDVDVWSGEFVKWIRCRKYVFSYSELPTGCRRTCYRDLTMLYI